LRGDLGLRIEVARRALSWGCIVSPDDVIITTGSTEALKICLEAITKPGEIVAVESPTYVGILLAIESLHLHVVEIPTDPQNGMDLDSFALTASRQRISALVIVPNFSNPTGSKMPDNTKRRLVELCESKGIPIVEDDALGDLSYGCARPLTLKAFDQGGNVLLCGSLSKTLSPHIRLGWAVPGMSRNRVLDAKFSTTTWGVSYSEMAAAEFLRHANFDRHLRRLRAAFKSQVAQMVDSVAKYFPGTACIYAPQGGYFVWIRLPSCVDAMELHMAAHQRRVSIAPGPMFSASGGFRNYIRLNAGRIWSPQIEAGIKVLGRLIKQRL
jgi:DNA-binding transcriptional MocR family regulator